METASKRRAATAVAMERVEDNEVVVDWSADGSVSASTNKRQKKNKATKERKKKG